MSKNNIPADISHHVSDAYPASLMQRQFWVLHSCDPYSPTYNLPLVSMIEGALDIAALDTAINTLTRRHRIFRATFNIDSSGILLQRFVSWQKTPLLKIDLRPSPGVAAEETIIEQMVTEEIKKPFDLAVGPPLRFRLFRTGESSHLFVITVHHIVFDLATKDLFAEELAKEYKAALLGIAEAESAELNDYAAFSAWQERWMQSDDYKKKVVAWRHYLEKAEPTLNLPVHQPHAKPTMSRSGSIVPIRLTSEMLAQVKIFCHKENVLPFLVLLTAWTLTLAQISGQTKLCVGVPRTNRRKDEFKQTMGCFVNILPLSVDLTDNPTMHEALRRVRLSMLQIHRMQEMPYYHLVQLMRHAGKLPGNPLFQVGFTFEHPMHLQLEGVSVKPRYIHHGGAQLDLFSTLWAEDGEMAGVIEYDSDRFDLSVVKRIGESLLSTVNEICTDVQQKVGTITSPLFDSQQYMRGIVSNPDEPASELPILSADERHQLLIMWNDTKADYPADACIHQLFEEQAYRTPEAIAVEFEGQRLTYSELNTRSSQFAEHLQELGVGPDILVALYIERSLEMVIALLGILKAGGAYLPLDRMFPRDRLAFMLEDANPLVLVTLINLQEELPPHHAEVVCVDAFSQAKAVKTVTERPTSANLAYVLYTSGSTGKPKGVEISHLAVINFLSSMRKVPGMNAHDILLSVTTISFDILGLELWLPLTSGATVTIVSQEVTKDGKQLAKVIAESNATVMQATPATWRLLLESGWKGSPGLKILCGGEAWTIELANSLLSKCASLWNMYGPTETTIWSAVCQVRNGEPISLGRPIANTQFYVVDQQLQLLPMGTPGELLIGGAGLARGYLNQPEMTAEKFISDPFSGNKEARLYRTGDTVRYLPDGRLEFIGRLDQQVKIRGFRIELGDIESVLCEEPGIKQAAIVVHKNKGEKHLVAYVVPTGESKQSTAKLRAYLKQKLPSYMIPSTFVIMPDLPLTPNGKVDRKALSMTKKIQQTRVHVTSCRDVDTKIIEWNNTDRAYPLDKCLQIFIEEQVLKTPDAPALTFEDKTLSYKNLNNQVNRLAHFLQSKGVGPEILVGVCAFRSMEMVIALLAIVKAGGAYVPFDPTYPAKRLSYMINDSKVPIILAQKKCASLINEEASHIIYFEDVSERLDAFPSRNPPIKTNPDDLIYVIYTSGSTGNPKGVMNTHKGIVNRLLWMQETFQIDTSDTLVQKTPFSFDVSVWEFFWPLMCGARLVVASPEGHRDADYLLNLINREKITIIHFVPSMLRLLLESADQARCASLKHVILSGEALTIDLQKRYFNTLKAPLHNLYGPTEAAVDVSYWKCDPLSQNNVVPIGRPISNTKLYVLDESLQSVPVGESGELHIGGVQVARGYLNRPELTANKFIQDPFSNDPRARLYKTGDLCRFLPDGNIEYLGRIDFQVKIRGNRVELGEIEEALRRDQSVKDCAVTLREDIPGDQQLVAYVVENEERFSLSEIRKRLAADLPDYMVPAIFVLMPALPLSPSGKIDRLALPKPDHKRPDIANKYVAPRGEIEQIIVKIWQDILPVETVGLDDNFFDLGGHSLLLVRMVGIFEKSFRKEISVIDLFERPTVREQAELISGVENGTLQKTTVNDDDWEDGEI
jgi:amino acid adenylation domain-containing protein